MWFTFSLTKKSDLLTYSPPTKSRVGTIFTTVTTGLQIFGRGRLMARVDFMPMMGVSSLPFPKWMAPWGEPVGRCKRMKVPFVYFVFNVFQKEYITWSVYSFDRKGGLDFIIDHDYRWIEVLADGVLIDRTKMEKYDSDLNIFCRYISKTLLLRW